jgi:hypothetical protein
VRFQFSVTRNQHSTSCEEKDISKNFMIPVINGVTSAAKLVESLVSLGLQISKSSGAPKAKTYLGRSQSH